MTYVLLLYNRDIILRWYQSFRKTDNCKLGIDYGSDIIFSFSLLQLRRTHLSPKWAKLEVSVLRSHGVINGSYDLNTIFRSVDVSRKSSRHTRLLQKSFARCLKARLFTAKGFCIYARFCHVYNRTIEVYIQFTHGVFHAYD